MRAVAMKFVITVDDAGLGLSREQEERSIAFFDEFKVPASFFVVPCSKGGGELTDDPAWVARARGYEARGHDYQLHGYTHEGFEFGPPEQWMIDLCGEHAQQMAVAGFPEYREQWTPDSLRSMLGKAMAAFERAFDRPPEVFRAGCLAAGGPAFDAMAELGLRYDSNKVVDPRGWDYMVGKFDTVRGWDPRVPPWPYRLTEGVVEVPCMSEYAWTPTEETVPRLVDLALQDLGRAEVEGGVFILMCHQQRVGADDDLSRRILSRLFEEARRAFSAEFLTLRELVAQIERGEQPVASGTQAGS